MKFMYIVSTSVVFFSCILTIELPKTIINTSLLCLHNRSCREKNVANLLEQMYDSLILKLSATNW